MHFAQIEFANPETSYLLKAGVLSQRGKEVVAVECDVFACW